MKKKKAGKCKKMYTEHSSLLFSQCCTYTRQSLAPNVFALPNDNFYPRQNEMKWNITYSSL